MQSGSSLLLYPFVNYIIVTITSSGQNLSKITCCTCCCPLCHSRSSFSTVSVWFKTTCVFCSKKDPDISQYWIACERPWCSSTSNPQVGRLTFFRLLRLAFHSRCRVALRQATANAHGSWVPAVAIAGNAKQRLRTATRNLTQPQRWGRKISQACDTHRHTHTM